MAPAPKNTSTTRQLVIKTGVVNRVVKELQSYKSEAVTMASRVEKMEQNNEDEAEIRQQKRVHAESLAMIPDSEQRLAKAVAELEDLIEASEEETSGAEELEKAKQAVAASGVATSAA
ncbi:tubulin binding cofactor A [Microbotryum lychnidis-dioicae p1A1 Lamole]|uniref:Tubulin-specific chaperone A n=2 Tax=Microbotryum TaxID=34416 RepID=U5H2S2_USTV1|nr:tubulin binding cofactor A [Microbotryum lychnidis-dioicae p1A1 Lamole]SGZ24047.1 BQ5605_C023g09691 [Microbotryum silenes-dioicae]|eukprot:KDE08175.1 tubulin binding cofactor A [Microbotryum lychnidis-dioicae p1A1 Lamole]